ncbi:MAG: zinc-dependent peptidase [Gemmatimonadota bacterium]
MIDPMGLLAVLAALGLMGGTLVLGRRLTRGVRWTRPVRLRAEPVPDGWEEIVRGNVPLTRKLSDADFTRLLKLVQVFLATKRIDGAGGLRMTEEIRVTIAAQACLLVLWLEVGLFPGLQTVVVYPGTVVARRVGGGMHTGVLTENQGPTPILGESWRHGVVVLSWDSSRQGAFDPRDGKNVVFHEFAHQLDQETGEADGVPVGLRLSSMKPWAEVLEARFQQLTRARDQGEPTVMDTYGATNRGEFFAVATEVFFEKPQQLRESKPDLYDLLRDFYRVDPAEGMRGLP